MTLPDRKPSKRRCEGPVHLKDENGRWIPDEGGGWQTRPCKRRPIKGGNVCPSHGGKAPQVVAAAKARLAMNSDRVAVELVEIALNETAPYADRIRAIVAVLDRAGIPAGLKVDASLELKGWQEVWQSLMDEEADDDDEHEQPAMEDGKRPATRVELERADVWPSTGRLPEKYR